MSFPSYSVTMSTDASMSPQMKKKRGRPPKKPQIDTQTMLTTPQTPNPHQNTAMFRTHSFSAFQSKPDSLSGGASKKESKSAKARRSFSIQPQINESNSGILDNTVSTTSPARNKSPLKRVDSVSKASKFLSKSVRNSTSSGSSSTTKSKNKPSLHKRNSSASATALHLPESPLGGVSTDSDGLGIYFDPHSQRQQSLASSSDANNNRQQLHVNPSLLFQSFSSPTSAGYPSSYLSQWSPGHVPTASVSSLSASASPVHDTPATPPSYFSYSEGNGDAKSDSNLDMSDTETIHAHSAHSLTRSYSVSGYPVEASSFLWFHNRDMRSHETLREKRFQGNTRERTSPAAGSGLTVSTSTGNNASEQDHTSSAPTSASSESHDSNSRTAVTQMTLSAHAHANANRGDNENAQIAAALHQHQLNQQHQHQHQQFMMQPNTSSYSNLERISSVDSYGSDNLSRSCSSSVSAISPGLTASASDGFSATSSISSQRSATVAPSMRAVNHAEARRMSLESLFPELGTKNAFSLSLESTDEEIMFLENILITDEQQQQQLVHHNHNQNQKLTAAVTGTDDHDTNVYYDNNDNDNDNNNSHDNRKYMSKGDHHEDDDDARSAFKRLLKRTPLSKHRRYHSAVVSVASSPQFS